MNVSGRLYLYELRKILYRKMVWIVGGIMILLCAFLSISDIVSTTYSGETRGIKRLQIIKDYAENLSGRSIDDDLLREMQNSYRKDMTEGDVREYVPIYLFVQSVTEDDGLSLDIDSEELYLLRQNSISQNRTDQMLTDNELKYWEQKESQIEIPFTYEYADGWSSLWSYVPTINYMLFLLIGICLSNVFSVEHSRKTDAVILCSQYGRKQLYTAKILAGITFGAAASVILFGVAAISSMIIYGTDGYSAALQIAFPMSSRTMSIGESVIVIFFIQLLSSVLYSVITMFLSEVIKNNAAVMAIPVGIMILTMLIDIPYQFRMFSQIYDLFPTNLLMVWELWDDRLISLFGNYLTNFQIAPILYSVFSIILIFVGNRAYQRYQISAR